MKDYTLAIVKKKLNRLAGNRYHTIDIEYKKSIRTSKYKFSCRLYIDGVGFSEEFKSFRKAFTSMSKMVEFSYT